MIYLIIGGSASGKSLIGETKAQMLTSKEKLYIATMEPTGIDGMKRVSKHQNMRKDKGFETIEKYHSLNDIDFGKLYGSILLECVSNLLANEIFSENLQPEKAVDKILCGIKHVSENTDNLIIISNDIFRDDVCYNRDTQKYINTLGYLNQEISKFCHVVIESVFGLEIYHKGVDNK